MAITKYEGRTGGKFCKQPLRQVPSTPYERPPSAVRGIYRPLPANEVGGSGWFSKLVDPAVRLIVRSASRVFSSVYGKGLAATSGKNISTIEEVSNVKSSIEVREQGGNCIDIRLSILYDGSEASKQELISRVDAIFQVEQPHNHKRFSRAKNDHLDELLYSRTIEPSTSSLAYLKNQGKKNNDLSINPSSSHQVVNHEKEKGVIANIREEGFDSPIEIARAFLGCKPRKATPSIVGLRSKVCHRDEARFGNKLAKAAISSKSGLCFPVIPVDSQNNYMAQMPVRGQSTLSKLRKRFPYCRSSMMTNLKALKRGSSDRDEGCFDDARKVRQKSCLEDLNLSTRADTSSSLFLGQEHKEGIDLNGLNNQDCKMPLASVLYAPPPQSAEIARKYNDLEQQNFCSETISLFKFGSKV